MRQIVDSMIDPLADQNGNVTLDSFKRFLGQNPALKTMVQLSVKPSLWTLKPSALRFNEHDYAQFRLEDIVYDMQMDSSATALKSSTLDNHTPQRKSEKLAPTVSKHKKSTSCFGSNGSTSSSNYKDHAAYL
jgi:hypothetical protein